MDRKKTSGNIAKPPTAIKKKIIKVARKKFAKNGYQKTSVNDIIKSAKVSKGVLFHHFHSKEELFFVVLSESIDLEFRKLFDLFATEEFRLFEKREQLFEDLKKYYDMIIDGTKEFERLWFEGAIESENNSKLRQMMIKKDNEVATMTVEMLKGAREQIGILAGYNDMELFEISKGVTAVFRGIFIDKVTGKDPREIRNVFARILYIIYNSKK